MKWITCPLCFERIAVPEVGWECEHLGCNHEVFFRPKVPLAEKLGLWRSPQNMRHDSCGKMASKRICPECKGELPSEFKTLPHLSIAVIGAKGSGKSHYVALLIQRIKEMVRKEFDDWECHALTDETIDRYKEVFADPLFGREDDRRVIASTRPVGNQPLLYSLTAGRKRVMLAFFDAAGESLQQGTEMSYIKRYIYKSAGLICLLDPLQFTSVREVLVGSGHQEAELPPQEADPGSIVERVARVIRDGLNLRGKKINIPLAVAFSKMDFVGDAGETAAAMVRRLRKESRHSGVFDEADFREIDGQMHSWMEEVDSRKGLENDIRAFRRTGFFGFSALGSNPVGGRLQDAPHPFRVEDPLLWILAQNRLIRTRKM